MKEKRPSNMSPKARRRLNKKNRRSVRASIKNYIKMQNIEEFDVEDMYK